MYSDKSNALGGKRDRESHFELNNRFRAAPDLGMTNRLISVVVVRASLRPLETSHARSIHVLSSSCQMSFVRQPSTPNDAMIRNDPGISIRVLSGDDAVTAIQRTPVTQDR